MNYGDTCEIPSIFLLTNIPNKYSAYAKLKTEEAIESMAFSLSYITK